MTIGKKIKERRKELGLSADVVAAALGVSRATVFRYENGSIEKVPGKLLAPLAAVLQTTPGQLLQLQEDAPEVLSFPAPAISENTVSFHPLGEVAAGYEHFAWEDMQAEAIEIPRAMLRGRPREDFFLLTVCGQSMYPHYQNGDHVLVLKKPVLERSGDVAVVLYDGDKATLKKVEYTPGEDWLRLVPLNPNYPPITLQGSELESCRILGVPHMLIREMNG